MAKDNMTVLMTVKPVPYKEFLDRIVFIADQMPSRHRVSYYLKKIEEYHKKYMYIEFCA